MSQGVSPLRGRFSRVTQSAAWAQFAHWPVQMAAVAIASLLVNVAIGAVYGSPSPGVHDEFANLLLGDTFAQGRLTNPTHPMWGHFETYHVFHHPSYQAKYPPAQGLFLALGEIAGGRPILGVWLSLALACAATYWMLLAILPRSWAFLGGMLLALHPHVIAWWGQSYWGGAVAALGGALLFATVFRFQQGPQRKDALFLAIGVALLANSRPLEGAMACLVAAPLLVAAAIRWRRAERDDGGDPGAQLGQLVWHFVVPLSLALLGVAAWMLYYNYRLTGEALTLPYMNWHPEASAIESIRTFDGPERVSLWANFETLRTFYIAPPVLYVGLLGSLLVLRDARARFCLLVSLIFFVLSTRFTSAFPHYIAPITCLVVAVLIYGLRALASLKVRGKAVGAVFVAVVLTVAFSWDALYLRQMLQSGPMRGSLPSPRHWDAAFEAPAKLREEMIAKLEAQPGKDLIFVRYEPGRFVDRFEWVYNAADIDAAEVVWARERSDKEDAQLRAHFKARRAWLLEPAARPLRLGPLRPGGTAPARRAPTRAPTK